MKIIGKITPEMVKKLNTRLCNDNRINHRWVLHRKKLIDVYNLYQYIPPTFPPNRYSEGPFSERSINKFPKNILNRIYEEQLKIMSL